jgi:hypothetical protein
LVKRKTPKQKRVRHRHPSSASIVRTGVEASDLIVCPAVCLSRGLAKEHEKLKQRKRRAVASDDDEDRGADDAADGSAGDGKSDSKESVRCGLRHAVLPLSLLTLRFLLCVAADRIPLRRATKRRKTTNRKSKRKR